MTIKNKLTLMLAGIVIVVVGLAYFVLLPLQGSIHAKSDSLYQERINTEIAKLERQNALVTKSEFERLQSQSNTIDTYFVEQGKILDFISSLENSAQRSGVKQEIQNLKNPESTSQESTIQIVLHGSAGNLVRYLQELEAAPVYVTISRIDISATDQGAEAGNAVMTLQAKLFWK